MMFLTLCVTIAGHEGRAAMPSGPGEQYDFFLSRRGSVATIAQEVTHVLTESRCSTAGPRHARATAKHLVGAREQLVRHLQTERLRLEIDD
jgi:hypothetical protein